jgi:uncharacterized membrane protein HdeD (DUF308 family)
MEPIREKDREARRAGLGTRLTLAGAATLVLALAALSLPLTAEWWPGAASVGWLLLLAGLVELLAGAARPPGEPRRLAMLTGAVTLLAGLLFALDVYMPFMTAAYIVMAWLFVRGALLLRLAACPDGPAPTLVRIAGFADLLLALVLLVGVPVSALVVVLFGPTPELVASFALVFAASFLVTGLMLLFLARAVRLAPAPPISPRRPS